MRKKHAGIILTTILAASIFAGCGSKASDKKEEVTITESSNGGTDRRVSENTRKCKCTGKL